MFYTLGGAKIRISAPTSISNNNELYTDICAGNTHVAAISTTNKLYYWGTILSQSGTVLMNSTLPTTISLTALGSSTPTKIYCVHSGILLVDSTNNIYSLGSATTLGSGSSSDSTSFSQIYSGVSITSASGLYNTVIIQKTSDSSLEAWGSNSNGQLGDNTYSE